MRFSPSIRDRGALPSLGDLNVLGAVVLTALALSFAAVPSPAHAQGFFETLFGLAPAKPKPRPRVRNRRQQAQPASMPLSALFGPVPQMQQRRSRRPRRSGPRLRTVCVRVCDGSFFPISFATTRRGLKRDASICSKRCPGQGRLFTMASPAGEIDDARDVHGQPYAKLANAFRYRREYVAGCACRPPPWSHEERLRHAMYGSETDLDLDKLEATIVAGRYDRSGLPIRRAVMPGKSDGAKPDDDVESSVGDGDAAAGAEPADAEADADADIKADTDEEPAEAAALSHIGGDDQGGDVDQSAGGPVDRDQRQSDRYDVESDNDPVAGAEPAVARGRSASVRPARARPTARQRARVKAGQRRRKSKAKAAPASGGLFGFGGGGSGGYTWPGD